MKVALIFGSQSDLAIMKKAVETLKEFDIPFSSRICSAHRCPELLAELLSEYEKDGTEVIIAGAGIAAHLPGVIASQTLIPVIGVPVGGGALNGLDALYSIVQMPKSVPVAAIGIDNASNAAYLAAQILGIKYPEIRTKLQNARAKSKEDLKKNSFTDF